MPVAPDSLSRIQKFPLPRDPKEFLILDRYGFRKLNWPHVRLDREAFAISGQLERDLLTRRQRAETDRWLGEIEGIDLTLTFLRAKREQAQRLSQRPLLQIRSTGRAAVGVVLPPASGRAAG